MSLQSWPPQTTLIPSELMPCLFSPSGAACRGLHRADGASQHPHGPGHYVLYQSPADPDMLHCHSPSCRKQGTHTCAAEAPGGTGQGKGRSKHAHTPILEGNQRGPNGEELEEGKVGSRTYSRLVTEVSATELRLGIEGRVSPAEDKTWPPCGDQGRGQTVIRSRVAQTG